MIFMDEENKGKTIVLNKKIVIAIALIIVIAIVAFLFFRPSGKYITDDSPVLDINGKIIVGFDIERIKKTLKLK